MKKLTVVSMIVVLLVLAVVMADAAEMTGVITNFVDWPSELLIKMTNQTNPGGCAATVYLQLNMDGSESSKRRRQALLASYLWGKTVIVGVSGCSGGGSAGRALITNTELK